VEEIKRTLAPVPGGARGGGFQIEYKLKGFVFECEDKETGIKFEMEICKIKGTDGWNGVRLKRMRGDLWLYKDLCQKILAKAKL